MILAWVGIVCLVAAAVVGVRWFVDRVDSLGRRKPFPWFGVGVFVAIALGALVPFFLRLRLEEQLASAASEVVGAPVEVHCQAFGEAFVDVGQELGYVRFGPDGVPERKTLIKRQQCRDLASYVRNPDEITREHVVAVHTLTHEAIHMSGVSNEAETECLAVQHNEQMARLLGASPEDARRLAVYYWEQVYPRMPESYRSDDCPGVAR
ncbi:MAG: hypothetical protein KY391_05905 [Actinobacteria bacterium]|nr:hypothetical protein [Actinomycetota bacterium]